MSALLHAQIAGFVPTRQQDNKNPGAKLLRQSASSNSLSYSVGQRQTTNVKEALTTRTSTSIINSQPDISNLTVRFQVWHYNEAGQTFKDNERLAQFLIPALFPGWDVAPVPPVRSLHTSGGCYVPIEVDIIASEPDCIDPVGNTSILFFERLSRHVTEFFARPGNSSSAEPHHLSISPADQSLPEEIRKRFTHLRVLKRLTAESQTDFVAPRVTPKRDAMTAVFDIAGALPSSAALVADIAIVIRDISAKFVMGASMQDEWERVRKSIYQNDVGQTLVETCSTTAVNTDKDKELATITNRAYQYLECFRLVSSDMRDCFEKISSKEVIPPQELYEAIVTANSAMKLYKAFDTEMENAAAMIATKHDKTIKDRRRTMALVAVASIAFILATIISGGAATVGGALGVSTLSTKIAACSAATVVGGGVNGYLVRENLNTLEMEKKVEQLLYDMVPLRVLLARASVSLTAMFCAQVLQRPMVWLDKQARRQVLVDFGIDLALLGDKETDAARRYTTETHQHQLRLFCQQFTKVQEKYNDVVRDVGMRVKAPALEGKGDLS